MELREWWSVEAYEAVVRFGDDWVGGWTEINICSDIEEAYRFMESLTIMNPLRIVRHEIISHAMPYSKEIDQYFHETE